MKRTFAALGIIFGIMLTLLLAGIFYYLGVTQGAGLDTEKLALQTDCMQIYDANGDLIEAAKLDADVSYETFPDYLPHAFVAVEDKRFYNHKGFDVRGIARATMKNISTFSFREGASTISQQLIKNTHLSSEKTLSRKLKEFKLTRILEKRYSKEQIMELYLNSIYFGHSAFGIGSAAQFYFGKTPNELTLAESAMLAALVKSPNRYSPFKDAEKCLGRRNLVIQLMREQNYIEEEEYTAALAEPLPTAPAERRSGNAYLSLVYEELSEMFPDSRAAYLGSLRIDTAYEPKLQSVLEATNVESDVALFVRGTKNNAIKAFHSTVGLPKRLPASTIKPLLVYGPAIEENFISPATPILDARTDFGGYSPDDAGGASGKYVSARYALSRSVNIPAVKILNTIGIERGASYLEKMNLHVAREDFSLALALGGMREGFTLKELTDGYATFAKSGNYAPSGAIVKITDNRGNTLYERKERETKVFSEETSFLIDDMLATTAKEGTAKRLSGLPYFVAAKTGTAEGKAGNIDAYTIAYTSEDVVAAWIGNRDNSPVQTSGGGVPANLVKRTMETLYEDKTPASIQRPAGVENVLCDKTEYDTKHKIVLADPAGPRLESFEEYFKRDALPKDQCSRFTCPTIQKPEIFVKNGCVTIVLCHAEYYDYVVKRENRGEVTTIYKGAYCQTICDNSVRAGESYRYTVLPIYQGREGVAVELPQIHIAGTTPLPDDWWEE